MLCLLWVALSTCLRWAFYFPLLEEKQPVLSFSLPLSERNKLVMCKRNVGEIKRRKKKVEIDKEELIICWRELSINASNDNGSVQRANHPLSFVEVSLLNIDLL